jgi:lipoprotein-anchoring transpeptidase ErfK/SrfK
VNRSTKPHRNPTPLHAAIALACALALAPFAVVAQDEAQDGARSDQPTSADASSADDVTFADANETTSTEVRAGTSGAAALRAQVLLDRAHFSPGEIDGAYGGNTREAIEGFQRSRGLEPTGVVDARTWEALDMDTADVLVSYTIGADDIAGPFREIPADMEAKAGLERLGYSSALEALGEKFHASPALLEKLNPGGKLEAGAEWRVPNVADPSLPQGGHVVVDRSDAVVRLVGDDGRILAQWPASMGSEHDPLPIGEWEIKGVARDPVFHYNPDLFWDAEPGEDKAEIAPGPNNPVGVVWIDLSKKHYGIHGTPEPSTIGKTQSHGCIRMTNWSARALAEAVAPGTRAVLQE